MSSKRAIRRRACKNKHRHESIHAAIGHITSLHRMKGYQGQLNPYHCRFCGGYHVGHGPRKV